VKQTITHVVLHVELGFYEITRETFDTDNREGYLMLVQCDAWSLPLPLVEGAIIKLGDLKIAAPPPLITIGPEQPQPKRRIEL
jgi:hypothetical protein